jgi:DNA-binding LytR/AlgR family response regulator
MQRTEKMTLPASLKVLVVEDSPNFLQLIELLLRETGVTNIISASDYQDGLSAFQTNAPDICILDIGLGKDRKSGINLAEVIRAEDEKVPIIFLTANYTEDYYEQSLHTRPSGFMNKELSRFRIRQALDIALMHREGEPLSSPASDAGRPPAPPPPVITQHQFFFKIGDIYKAISVKEIQYFYADSKLTFARSGQRNYPTNVQLKTLEEEFAALFVRIHKTYLVNVQHIDSIHPRDNSVVVVGESLPIGYAYRKSFFNRLKLLR